jgi:hypothetical protein
MVAHEFGVILGDAAGRQPHGLDRAPDDLGVRIVREGGQHAQNATPARGQRADLVRISLLQELTQTLLHHEGSGEER